MAGFITFPRGAPQEPSPWRVPWLPCQAVSDCRISLLAYVFPRSVMRASVVAGGHTSQRWRDLPAEVIFVLALRLF